MPDTERDRDEQHAADVRRRYLIRFEEDTLRSRPPWIRVIIGAAIAVGLIGLVRGLPDKAETHAAEGRALPG
ncbi:MAG TPA: hypothetical protein VMV92_21225 [Streptosporangiaceae bacterium]|nr:hypothetical protein [Streptosporangiaceae bacterium]